MIYVLLIGVVFMIMQNGMKWRLELEEKKRLKAVKEDQENN
jgi:hypothetical protein